jgi:acyl-CoA synthetase (NDP forming)
MLGVFTAAGFDAVSRFADGVVEVRFEIATTPDSVAAAEARASHADARTVARLLEPRSVAVIGAGRRPGTIGHEVFRQLVSHEFTGPVYPINREASHVASVPAWPSVLDVPGTVDLAVIAVPAAEVLDAVEECARARVGALVIVSTGFAEEGTEGLARAQALVSLAHRHGIRVLGPASFGVINTSPSVRLHATFAPTSPVPGRVGLSMQTGTLTAGIIRQATARGIGFASVAAVGDKLDVSGNDLLAWWEGDDRTDVIVLSLASYGNPRRFRRLAPRIGRTKPIVAMLREEGPDANDLLEQMGVIPVATIAEMLDVTAVLAGQPVPAGDRVAVIADALGSTEFTMAACRAAGLEVVSSRVVGGGAEPSAYGTALRDLLGPTAPVVADAAVVVYATALAPRPDDVAREVAAAASSGELAGKAVVAAFPGHDLGGNLPAAGGRRIPDLGFPDTAARALAAVVRHGIWRGRPIGDPPVLARVALGEEVAALVAGPERALDPVQAAGLLAAAGATVVEQRSAASAEEAAEAARHLGGPVSLKAIGRPPLAKTEAAGVAIDLHTPEEVAASWSRMAAALGAAMTGAAVQAMVAPGTDVRVVLAAAPIVGAAIGVGPGGAQADALVPMCWGALPLTGTTAADLVDRSGLGELLDVEDAAALVDLVLRVSLLAEEVPEVRHLVVNPVIVGGGTAWVIDVAADVGPDDLPPGAHLRRLGE